MRVWERDSGALHAVGEAAEGLSGPLTWQPNGRHLYAAACSTSAARRILLYERNGLRHGGFDVLGHPGTAQLPNSRCLHACRRTTGRQQEVRWWTGAITSLQWSPDSELLAVVLQVPANGPALRDAGTPQGMVQIWQRSNWHWYLKQELAGFGSGALHVVWEPEGLRLHMHSSRGEHRLVSLLNSIWTFTCRNTHA